MRVNVHIDRLVVAGAALTPAERAGLAAAVRGELARLLNPEAPGAGAHAARGPRRAAEPAARDVAAAVAAAIHRVLPARAAGPPPPTARRP